MVTNEERHEIARELRELPIDMYEVLKSWAFEGIDTCCSDQTDYYLIHQAVFGCIPADHMHPCDYEELHMRLADLIDPDPDTNLRDLTCELEPTASERTDAPVRVYECDHCGRSCDVVYAEDYVYCPYCGRLNTNREVEVEE